MVMVIMKIAYATKYICYLLMLGEMPDKKDFGLD